MIILGSPEALLSGKWRQMILLSWNKRLVAVAVDKAYWMNRNVKAGKA